MKAEKEELRSEKKTETSHHAQTEEDKKTADVQAEEATNKKLNKAK